jgi:hypothetical protein
LARSRLGEGGRLPSGRLAPIHLRSTTARQVRLPDNTLTNRFGRA